MSSLSLILSDLLSAFYTLSPLPHSTASLFSLLDSFQSRLHAFSTTHLCQLRGENSGLVDSSGSVILAFFTVEIVLFRAILRRLPMEERGYAVVRGLARKTVAGVVGFLEKLGVGRLRAFWWCRTSPCPRVPDFGPLSPKIRELISSSDDTQ